MRTRVWLCLVFVQVVLMLLCGSVHAGGLTLTDLVLPFDVETVVLAVMTAGATVMVAVLGVWLAFRIVDKGARRIGRGV